MSVEFNTHDMSRDQFFVAGKAWQLCRGGQANPDRFALDTSDSGREYIASQFVRDLVCLNKMELLEWDCWGVGDTRYLPNGVQGKAQS